MAIHAAKHKLANCRILENALLMRWQDGFLPRFPRFHCTPAKKPTKWHPCKDGSRVEGYKNQPRDSRPDTTVSCLCLDAGDLAMYSTYIPSYPSRGRASPRQPQSKCMGFGCIRALSSRAVSGVEGVSSGITIAAGGSVVCAKVLQRKYLFVGYLVTTIVKTYSD